MLAVTRMSCNRTFPHVSFSFSGPPLNKAKLYKHQNKDQYESDSIIVPSDNRSNYQSIGSWEVCDYSVHQGYHHCYSCRNYSHQTHVRSLNCLLSCCRNKITVPWLEYVVHFLHYFPHYRICSCPEIIYCFTVYFLIHSCDECWFFFSFFFFSFCYTKHMCNRTFNSFFCWRGTNVKWSFKSVEKQK